MGEEFLTREQNRYSMISPGTVYESQVAALIERNISSIFTEYFGKGDDPYLRTAAGDVQPDLVLLKNDFTGWALVEVEDDTHPFRRHVLPQISKMTYASADEKLILRINERIAPGVEREKIEEALSRKPKVFLIVHGSSEKFNAEISELGVEAIDIDIHESTSQPNEYVLMVRDRTSKLIDLECLAQRSNNPITKFCWTINSSLLQELFKDKSRVQVDLYEKRAIWGVSSVPGGLIIRQPSDMSHVDSTFIARVFFDKESEVIHLIP